jgi:hypothetical protein
MRKLLAGVLLATVAIAGVAQFPLPPEPFSQWVFSLNQAPSVTGDEIAWIVQGGIPKKVPLSLIGSGGSQSVPGVGALRLLSPTNNRYVNLAYHTTAGDLGSGYFIGSTGQSPGTYVDNNGTIIVPTGGNGSAAWLRVWDQQNADMGWWGAKFDHVTDDYNAWAQAISLFSSGGTCAGVYGSANATLNVHQGFNHSKPLIYAGCNGAGLTITGAPSPASAYGGATSSYLAYTGPSTHDQMIIFAANGSFVRNLSFILGNANNGLHFLADNVFCNGSQCNGSNRNSITNSPAPGTSVTINVMSTYGLAVGTQLGLGYGTTNFEIVAVTSIGVNSIVVERVLNSHNSNELIGGGGAENFITVDNLFFSLPNILQSPSAAAILIGNITANPRNQVSDIIINHSGCGVNLGVGSFTGTISNGSGGAGTLLDVPGPVTGTPIQPGMYVNDLAGAGSGAGLVLTPTKIVSQNSPTQWVVDISQHVASEAMGVFAPGHACIMQTEGGNVKNMTINYFLYQFIEVAADFRAGSGFVDITEMQGSNAFDAVFLFGGANFNIYNFEDESFAMLFRATCGSNDSIINFFSGSYQSSPPTGGPNVGQAGSSGCSTTGPPTMAVLPSADSATEAPWMAFPVGVPTSLCPAASRHRHCG